MQRSSWSAEDERILMAHYGTVGPSWDGWSALLPDHGRSDISERAIDIGLDAPSRQRPRNAPHSVSDSEVMRMFRNGFAPSRIDRILNMRSGFAHDIIVRMWNYEKSGIVPIE